MYSKLLAVSTMLLVVHLAGCSANSGGAATTSNTSGTSTAGPATVKLTITPLSYAVGQTAVATWTSSGDTSCEASGAWNGPKALSNTVGYPLPPIAAAGTYSYGVTCTGAGGSGSSVVLVTVGAVPAPTIKFAITPDTILPGASASITWSTTNATSCAGSGGTRTDTWQGPQPTADAAGFASGPISTSGQYAYELTCTGPGGSSKTTQILTVSTTAAPAAPVIRFAAQSRLVRPGQAASFSWTATGATGCAASGGSGSDLWTGPEPITSTGTSTGPINTAGTYSYTLTCTGTGGGTADSVDVVVSNAPTAPAVSVNVSVAPTQIVAGGSAALTWSTVNADSCTASGSWSGSEPLLGSDVSTGTLTTPAVYSYALTCSGAGGSGVDIAHLTVTPAGASILTFTATPSSVQAGGSTSLAWTTDSATSCAASGGTGSDGWGGATSTNDAGDPVGPLSPAGTYTYILSCIGPGGLGTPGSVTVTVTNATPPPASVTSFTATPSTVTMGANPAPTLAWTTANATTCTGSDGTSSWRVAQGTSSSGTPVDDSNAGSVTYTLTCTGPGGMGAPDSVEVNINPAGSTGPIITAFSVQPNPIQVGQSAALTWSSTNTTACTGSDGTGAWTGSPQPAQSSGTTTTTGAITTAGNYTYTLTCTGAGNTSSAPNSVVLNVNNAPPTPAHINSFAASPNSVMTGQSSQLSWTTTNASSCTGTGGAGSTAWDATQAVSSLGLPIGPFATVGEYTYTLSCTGSGGDSTPRSAVVDVVSAPPAASIVSFTATPTAVGVGGNASLAWTSTNATSCTASGGTGSDGWSSMGALAPASTGTAIGPINQTGAVNYTLTCTGPGGTGVPSTVTINVTATAPAATILGLMATPAAIQTGQSASLTWTSANAMSCTGTGGTGTWAGSQPTQSSGTTTTTGPIASPGTYTYNLTCTGTGTGTTSAVASTSVTVTTAPPPPSINTFAAAPSAVQTGQSTSLTWSTSNATSCNASGGTGADGWGGPVSVNPTTGVTVGPLNSNGTVIYTLTCLGIATPNAVMSVAVTVNTAPPAPLILSFTATPSPIQAGQSTRLAWGASNASTCAASGDGASEGWSGSQSETSSGVPVGPLSAGTYTFTLTCTGTSGMMTAPSSVTVTVNPATPAQPTVALSVSGSGQAPVGTSPTLTWTSTNANPNGCTASGGSTGDGWAGANKPTSSAGTAVGPLLTPGVYTYTLTCSGSGGSGSSQVMVTVAPAVGYACGIPGLSTATALVSPSVSVTSTPNSLCLACTTTNAGNVIDSTPSNFATIFIPLGLTGIETLSVNGTAPYPAGTTVGFIVSDTSGILSLAALGGLSVQTSLNKVVQQTALKTNLLQLQAAGLLSVNTEAGFVDFLTTKPFDSVSLSVGGIASLLTNWQVYSACVTH